MYNSNNLEKIKKNKQLRKNPNIVDFLFKHFVTLIFFININHKPTI